MSRIKMRPKGRFDKAGRFSYHEKEGDGGPIPPWPAEFTLDVTKLKRDHRPGRLLLTFLLAASFLILGALWVTGQRWDFQDHAGMELGESDGGLEITAVKEGGIAQRAGLRAGDRLLAFRGEPVDSFPRYRAAERDRYPAPRVRLTVQRRGTPRTVYLAVDFQYPWLQTVAVLLIVCVYLGIGFICLWKGKPDLRVRLLLMMTILASITVIVPDYYVHQKGGLLFSLINILLYTSYGALVAVEPHLALVIPEKKAFIRRHPGWLKALYFLGGLFTLQFVLDYFHRQLPVPLPMGVLGGIKIFFIASYQLLVPLGVFAILLHTFGTTAAGVKKIQTKIVLFGVFPWMVSMVASALFNLFTGQIPGILVFVNLLCIIPVPFAFLIAIFKFRLFDVELVIRKSLVYGLLTGLLFLVYYGTIGIGSGLFSLVFTPGHSLWVVAVATLLLGLLFNPLRKKIQWLVDRFFYPEKFHLRRSLPELSKEVASVTTLRDLVSRILENLSTLLHMKEAAFLLADEKQEKFNLVQTGGNLAGRGLEREIIFPASDPVMTRIARHKKPLTRSELYRQLETDHDFRLEKLQAGIIVPFHLKENLVAALLLGGEEGERKLAREDRDLLAIFANQVAAMLENARLFQAATCDDLTGLYRRHVFERVLKREIERCRRFRHPMVVGMADIDHFKRINDTMGHAAGDIVLKKIAFLINSNIRNIDCLARYGGEEFVFLLPETGLAAGRRISEKLRRLVAESSFGLPAPTSEKPVTISIGLTCWRVTGKGGTVEDLLAAADRALYRAKNRGRNRTEVHSPEAAE